MLQGVIFTANTISGVFNNKPFNITSVHPAYDKLKVAIKEEDWDTVDNLLDIKQSVTRATYGNVTIDDNDIVYYKGSEITGVIVDRLLGAMKEGYGGDAIGNFISNLYENPSHTAIKELFLFLESGHFPLTPDGYFLAYKKVRDDYTDWHTGEFDNSVGQTLTMERSQVDDNRQATCSRGFHFAAHQYAADFRSGRMMIVKINPADVVSIPYDYNNQKGRTWKYEVVSEVSTEYQMTRHIEDSYDLSYDEDEFMELYEESSSEEVKAIKYVDSFNGKILNVRDTKGHYISKSVLDEIDPKHVQTEYL